MVGYARTLTLVRGDLTDTSLEVGDVVRLKSGGPAMTVSKMEAGGVLACWYDRGGMLQTMQFPLELLERGSRKRSFFGLRR